MYRISSETVETEEQPGASVSLSQFSGSLLTAHVMYDTSNAELTHILQE